MKIIPITIFIISCFFLNPFVLADTNFPDWLKGKPDTKVYKSREKIYEYVFNDVESKTGISLVKEQLAKESITIERLAWERIINAVNKAVSHWQLHRYKKYKTKLPYLLSGEKDPVHYEFYLPDKVLKKSVIRK